MFWDKYFNKDKYDFETLMAAHNKKRRVEGIAIYFDVKFELMNAYCEKYGGAEDGVPVRYMPHTSMYKTIIKRLNTLERTLKINNILKRTKRKRNV